MDVYLDTAPSIYVVENVAQWEPAVRAFLTRSDLRPRTSVLARMECRVLPLREGKLAVLEDYDRFFSALGGSLLPLDAKVFETATGLRARYGFKTPDALHLAAAIESECKVFLSNDAQLARCREISVEVLHP